MYQISSVIKTAKIEATCSCCEGKCTLPDRKGKPIVNVEESPAGFKYIEIRWTCGMTCRYYPMSGEFGRMFRASGLIASQLRQTFGAMKHGHQTIFRLVNELLNEIRRAVAEKADYYGVIQRFKEVPYLVLDDLRKERTTDFGLNALYDIESY